MQIPRISQVPIIEPMYTNGVMNPAWVRFFEKLASLLNTGELADLLTLTQLANQLPTQATLGQMILDKSDAPMSFFPVSLPQDEQLFTVSVSPLQDEILPTATMPTSEIIKP